MTLATGARLGPYEIVAPLGAGGMGEVYRAKDTRLGREVAIKVLPSELVADADRLHRFEQEARAASALNHPNILTVHDVGDHGGTPYLVTELLEGESLRERLRAGPVTAEKAAEIGAQIARALAAAHEKGIVHRDLKPENLFLTRKGQVKILDFGLAKLTLPSAGALGEATTIAGGATAAGMILGTVGYMSPEQVRGEPADARSDLFSLGCVLHEMLTGERAFRGATAIETLNAILKEQPPDLVEDGRLLPLNFERIVRHCLEKDPADRFQSARDLAFDLESISGQTGEAATRQSRARPRVLLVMRRVATTMVLLLLGAVGLGLAVRFLTRTASEAPASIVRFALHFPPDTPLVVGTRPALALSPDGKRLAFVASKGAEPQLFLRSLDELEPRPLPGTEGGNTPLFSPDGEWLAFTSRGQLKKVPVAGGVPVTLCDSPGQGAFWTDDGQILLGGDRLGILRVPAAGGTPEVVAAPDAARGELEYLWPEMLPGGAGLLYATWYGGGEYAVAVLSPRTGERRILVEKGTHPHYSAAGYLVYSRAGQVFAAPFDVRRLELTGSPVALVDGVAMERTTGAAQVALSRGGALVYVPGAIQASDRELMWVDRSGAARPASDARRAFSAPRISPDGERVALAIAKGPDTNLWILELGRNTLTRLTFEASSDPNAVWTPDGERLTFSSDRDGPFNLYSIAAGGAGGAEPFVRSKAPQFPSSWSPDGTALAVAELQPTTGWDFAIVIQDSREARPFVSSKFAEFGGVFSPNGRWVAYVSRESGRPEVYVQAHPDPRRKWQVSNLIGNEPVWARNGKELFYRDGSQFFAVPVNTEGEFSAASPRALFTDPYLPGFVGLSNYDVSLDGREFLMIRGEKEVAPTEIHVVLNGLEQLKSRASTAGGSR